MTPPKDRSLVIGMLAGRGLFPHLLAERITGPLQMDDTSVVSSGSSYGVGTGCTVSGQEMTALARYTVFASVSRGMELYVETSPTVPGSRPADRFALIGFSNPGVAIGFESRYDLDDCIRDVVGWKRRRRR